jgi:hypothetical protein
MEKELIQHTPEPWKTDKEGYRYTTGIGDCCAIYHAEKGIIGFILKGDGVNDARRIVAAVNATAGITTEQLEFAAAENLKLDFQNRMKNLESEVEYLRSQNVQMRNALQGVCENIARATPTPAQPEPVNAQMLEALKRLVHHHAEEENSSPQYLDFALFSARAAIAAAEAHQPQPFQVIANLTRKLGDVIKALRFALSVLVGNGIIETSERLAIEKIDEALKPYDLSQQPTYGTGPMIQERPRPEEPDGPDPCDLARDFNDALQDGDQPTPYDEAKYRP